MKLYSSDPHISRKTSTKVQVKRISDEGDASENAPTQAMNKPFNHKIGFSTKKWPFIHDLFSLFFFMILVTFKLDLMSNLCLHSYS